MTTTNPTTLLDLVRPANGDPSQTRTQPTQVEQPKIDLTWDWPAVDRLMAERGYQTQLEFANAAGMQRQEMSRIRSGQHRPTSYTIAKICRALRCQPGDILSYD